MTIKQLIYFTKVFQKLNITQVAKDLYISQQGVSNSISDLEEELGKPLFTRKNHEIEPTVYARYLYAESIDVVKTFQNIKPNFSNHFKKLQSLNVAISPGILRVIPLSIIKEFENSQNISINISSSPDTECENSVLDTSVDLAFTINNFSLTNTNKKIIHSERLCVVFNNEHAFFQKSNISIVELCQEKMVSFDEKYYIYDNIKNLCLQKNCCPNIIFSSFDFETLFNYVSNENVVMICPEILSKYMKKQNPNIGYRFLDDSYKWEVISIYNKSKDESKNKLISNLINHVKSNVISITQTQ